MTADTALSERRRRLLGELLSGAGAVSTNTVLSKTNAYIEQSTVNSATFVSLDAQGTASIDATVVAASAALGFSTQRAVGASLGIGFASNLVGWKQDGTEDQAQVRSLVTNSSITTTGDLTLNALAEKAAGPARSLWGLEALDRGIPRPHMAVLSPDGGQAGEVTSGTFSPTLRKGIALALLRAGVGEGADVVVDVRGRRIPARVVKPPFVESHVR